MDRVRAWLFSWGAWRQHSKEDVLWWGRELKGRVGRLSLRLACEVMVGLVEARLRSRAPSKSVYYPVVGNGSSGLEACLIVVTASGCCGHDVVIYVDRVTTSMITEISVQGT